MTDYNSASAVLVSKKNAQLFRKILETSGVWDGSRRLNYVEPHQVAIPVLDGAVAKRLLDDIQLQPSEGKDFEIIHLDLPASRTSRLKQPQKILVENIKALMVESDMALTSDMLETIPKHWEIHGDLALLPGGAFLERKWSGTGSKLWNVVAKALGCNRVARKHAIANDDFRSPNVDLLLGDSGWVEHTDNGIKYTYDITRCMFSCGNVTEKMRVAQFDCTGETVVDLYAGIGYFTLPLLVHAKAELVHACEWNPAAVESLRRNLALNGVAEKCVVHQGDNRKVCPKGIADRVNLGLIPSSETGWRVACAALKQQGGILHIHSNVTTFEPRAASFWTSEEENISDNSWNCGSESENLPKHKCETQLNITGNLGDVGEWSEEKPKVATFTPGTRTFSDTVDGLSPSVSSKHSIVPEDMSQSQAITIGSESNQGNEEDFGKTARTSGQLLKTACKASFPYWWKWAKQSQRVIEEILYSIYQKSWRTEISHIEHVKSYAPHVDHIVVDLLCRPKS